MCRLIRQQAYRPRSTHELHADLEAFSCPRCRAAVIVALLANQVEGARVLLSREIQQEDSILARLQVLRLPLIDCIHYLVHLRFLDLSIRHLLFDLGRCYQPEFHALGSLRLVHVDQLVLCTWSPRELLSHLQRWDCSNGSRLALLSVTSWVQDSL